MNPCKLFLDQTQKTTQEILAGEDLRNSLDNHKQLEEVLSVMGKGLEIFEFEGQIVFLEFCVGFFIEYFKQLQMR